MGNVHHLQHLGQGTGSWNSWRKLEPNVQPDLTSANLRGANLSGMDLSGALLSLANLRKATLAGANLKDCNLPRANLEDADLSGSNLQKANLAGAWLLRANLSGASLRMANLAGANLAGKIDLSGVDLTGANLAGAKLVGANLSGATLVGANLAGVDARDANFTGADLTDTVTAGANLDGANMSGAVIRQSLSRRDLFAEDPAPPEADASGSENAELPFEEPPVAEAEPEPEPEPEFAPEPEPEFADVLTEEAEPVADEPAAELTADVPVEDIEPAAEEIAPAVEDIEPVAEEIAPAAEDIEPAVEALAEEFAEPLEEPVPEVLEAPPEEEAVEESLPDTRFFRYETKDMAILALYSAQIGRKTQKEKAKLLNLLVQYNQNYFGQDRRVPVTINGNAIMLGFDDPTDALQCGGLYIDMLRDMQVESYVAINWGTATVRIDEEGDAHDELVADSVSPMARLMPVGTIGEVLVLEELYSNPLTQADRFTFERVARKWKAATDLAGEGIDVICYSESSK